MNHKLLAPAMALLFACAMPTLSGPLKKQHVSADAKWLLHVDAEQLRHNPIADILREHHGRNHNGNEHKAELKNKFGFDSWDDLKSLLFYGTTYEKGNGALIIEAKIDQQAVLNLIKNKPNYATTRDGSNVLHSWSYTTKHHGQTREHTVTFMFYPGNITVMTRNPDQFGPAIDVLNGSAPSLAGGEVRLEAEPPAGVSIYAEAIGPIVRDNAPHEMGLLRQVKHLTMALVHGDDDLAMRTTITATNPRMALDVQKALEGLVAITMLRHGGAHGQLSDVLSAMRVKAEGNTVRVNWPMTNEQAKYMIKHHHAKNHRNHDKHDHKREPKGE